MFGKNSRYYNLPTVTATETSRVAQPPPCSVTVASGVLATTSPSTVHVQVSGAVRPSTSARRESAATQARPDNDTAGPLARLLAVRPAGPGTCESEGDESHRAAQRFVDVVG